MRKITASIDHFKPMEIYNQSTNEKQLVAREIMWTAQASSSAWLAAATADAI